MTGSPGRWLLTASLISVLSTTMPVLAQAGRPWVDPPPEAGATPSLPTPAPAASSPQAAAPAATPPTPQPSSASAPPQPAKDNETVAAQSRPEVSPRKQQEGEQVKQKTAAERKVRPSTQQVRSTARPQKREELATRRREPSLEVSQARPPRNGIERRARGTRYGSVQEGLDAGLQVMRLRTIQLPDGRRIEILTRPNQDIASQLPDGY
ncbi:pyruvate/2-oxoglutarate dehydrogenase complex dihydrolipoamide acyltransferase (E2) component [Microvirga lupini]|uniref:Pyruvate/2-oxoglutarate dehydrogenase complex dihydrolipoamide acyltransferase (E2) component n=1 Tax=Microvirga lupini TaxID=420324 RepID=A0A7W4VJI8_9HYPH|nr:pyruvate/2-oxoglutarate dehydrogenase complex dihydrolipoamide acyltransferase (E2) component [Microvirga lupini]